MTDFAIDDTFPAVVERPRSYLDDGTGLRSWLLTTDHKRIAVLYALTITFFFFVGGAAATAIRVELFNPKGLFLSNDAYNRMFTLHGVIMVWFFLVPIIPTTFGNFLLPLMIGARDVAFPKLNLFSWYLFVSAGLVTLFALVAGGVDTGWTFYEPLSGFFARGWVALAATGIFLAGFSTIATGLNFIVTTHTLRIAGMKWLKLPLFVWALYATSLIMLLATPVLAITLLLIFCERVFGIGIFDPDRGGDPILFQHLFWFYSHPAVYIMILPGMGVTTEIIACFARRRVFGYFFMVLALVSIAGIGFFVWGHHMFVAGQSGYANIVFSFLSFLVAVPSAIKVFNWTATLYRGEILFAAPMIYALGFVGLFTMGGLTGLFLASVPIDVHVTDTYFVVAHFHYIMVGGMVSAFFGGLHFWWPKATGRLYPEAWARFASLLMFFGFNFTFFPQFVMGYLGMPRRYHLYPPEFQVWHVLSSGGATILAAAYILPLFYLGWSLLYGARAPDDPWFATGLEWRTSSPPPTRNFFKPLVVREPYDYHPVGTTTRVAEMDAVALEETEAGDLADRLGIWVFLATEVLFFGGALAAFAVNRHLHPADFAAAARETNIVFGTVNTGVLLASSFTVALAVKAAEARQVALVRRLLAATAALAALFLILKGFEYRDDLAKHLWPGAHFALHTDGARIFWSFYWVLTSLHGVHVTIGIGVFAWVLSSLQSSTSPLRVEVPALYWHFVDLVWIFLYPLLYLGGRAQ